MFEGLCVIATLGSGFLFLCAISEAIELNEQKSQERREAIRKSVYAVKRKEWTIKQNRRKLWEDFSNAENQG